MSGKQTSSGNPRPLSADKSPGYVFENFHSKLDINTDTVRVAAKSWFRNLQF